MQEKHLSFLVCPKTQKPLRLSADVVSENGRIRSGSLVESDSGNVYPIVNFVPRFVEADNYAESFGFQWNLFKKTQLDEASRMSISRERFKNETGWPESLAGETILEAGSGAGRFTPHALETGATVVSFDYSRAVDANYESHGQHPNLLLVQANIYEIPFRRQSFDKVYCFGVLQHTPNPRKSFSCLVEMLKPGAELCTDIYLKTWLNALHVKYYFRYFLAGKDPEKVMNFTKKYVGLFWPFAKHFRKTYLGQKFISRFIAERSDYLKADDATLREWAELDTMDWFSPAFDKPETLNGFRRWHEEEKLTNLEVKYGYNGVQARGTRPK